MAYTLDGISLDVVINESVRKEANLTILPSWQNDSDQTYVFDFGGVSRVITIEGIKNDSLANLKTFINNIQNLLSGDQEKTKNYVSTLITGGPFADTIKVKILDFVYDWREGDPRNLFYTIKLVESRQDA